MINRLEQLVFADQEPSSPVDTGLNFHESEPCSCCCQKLRHDLELTGLSDSDSPNLTRLGQVGRYKLLELIKEGGEGQLYRAWDPETLRMVAVKVKWNLNSMTLEDWSDEGVLLSQIQHENLARVFDRGATEWIDYIVMEWVDGCTLKQLANSQRLHLETVLEIAVQLASVVGYLHQQGVVHLDLKPENVMVIQRDQAKIVKLIDFGLAWNYGRRSFPEGIVAGTPGFMAPEQRDGSSSTWGPPVDVFGLGAILHFLLLNTQEHAATQKQYPVSNRSGILAGNTAALYAALQQVCSHASCDDPVQRFQNGMEFKQALLRVQGTSRDRLSGTARFVLNIVAIFAVLMSGTARTHESMCDVDDITVDHSVQPAESTLQLPSMVIDLTATLTDSPDAGVCLWSRRSGPVHLQGMQQEQIPSGVCFSTGAGGLEVCSTVGPFLGVLAAEAIPGHTPDSLARQALGILNTLSGQWPEDAWVRISADGILPHLVALSREDFKLMCSCQRALKSTTKYYELVILPIPATFQTTKRKQVDLTLRRSTCVGREAPAMPKFSN